MLAAGATAVLGVELLSSLGLVRQLPLILLTLASVAGFGVVLRHRLRDGEPVTWSRPGHRLLLGSLLCIGGTTLLVALVAAPNSWDSMTYHMARVAQWYDHANVEPYYTAIDRQLWQPPFGEYFVLLGYGGLGGRDYLANLPQWLAGMGAVLVVMEIAALLGASLRSRYIIALFTATAPAVILQSSSTLTDLLGGFWVACAAWLALRQYLAPRFAAPDAVWFGLALGLAIGTKGTSIPLGLPWAVLFLLPAFRPFKPRTAALQAATIGLMILVLAGSHFLRNVSVYGNAFGPEAVQRMLRPASMDPPALLSNFVAHLSLQLGTPFASLNGLLSEAVASIHSALGVDLAALYPYFGGFRVSGWTFSEGSAGNLIQTLLGLAGIAVLLVAWRRIQGPERVMACLLLMGVLLFGLTVRWQPFIARLHTPIVVLLSPCLLLVLERQWPRITGVGLGAAFLFALPPLFQNPTRPLTPARAMGLTLSGPHSILTTSRAAQYFVNRPEVHPAYRSAIEAISQAGCRRAGLVAGYDSWEYPLWALGRKHDLHFVHRDPVRADPGQSRAPAGSSCATVALDQPASWRPGHIPAGTAPLYSSPEVTVWR
jgi:4-amino-4-deoxy-L-arabinose transferase-like glycosyltransferase